MFFGTVEKPPRLSEFELEVPEKLVADHPSKRRDGCKLMVLDTKEETIAHTVKTLNKIGNNLENHFDPRKLNILTQKELAPQALNINCSTYLRAELLLLIPHIQELI